MKRFKEIPMFKVKAGLVRDSFYTMEEAKALAEKESWLQNIMTFIYTPAGQTVKVKIG